MDRTGIGARVPRRELRRLLSGQGRYLDDIKLPRMLHACFVRSRSSSPTSSKAR
jgi:carbon-monoxide dehydrogenase large subunit